MGHLSRHLPYVEEMIKIQKSKDALDSTDTLTTLNNKGGRDAEHEQLMREQGFPSEQPLEGARYQKYAEIETDVKGKVIHNRPPWIVNEASEMLYEVPDDDAPSYKKYADKAKNTEGEDVKMKKALNKQLNDLIALTKARGEGGGIGWRELMHSENSEDRATAFSILDQRAHKFQSPRSSKSRAHKKLWEEFGEGIYEYEGGKGLESASPERRAVERRHAEGQQAAGVRGATGYQGKGIARKPGFAGTVVMDDEKMPMRSRSMGEMGIQQPAARRGKTRQESEQMEVRAANMNKSIFTQLQNIAKAMDDIIKAPGDEYAFRAGEGGRRNVTTPKSKSVASQTSNPDKDYNIGTFRSGDRDTSASGSWSATTPLPSTTTTTTPTPTTRGSAPGELAQQQAASASILYMSSIIFLNDFL